MSLNPFQSGALINPSSAGWNAQCLGDRAVPALGEGAIVATGGTNSLSYAPICTGGSIEGLTLSNNSTDPVNNLDIQPGLCMAAFSGGSSSVIQLQSTLTKQLNATWVQGSNQGGRFSGVSLTNTTYHVFLLLNLTTRAVDVGFDTSIYAVNRPSNWTYRRIGSIIRTASGIQPFKQYDAYFEYATPITDIIAAIPATPTLYTLTVPTGFNFWVSGVVTAGRPAIPTGSTSGRFSISVQSPSQNPQTPVACPTNSTFQGTAGALRFDSGTGDTFVLTYSMPMMVPCNQTGQISLTHSGEVPYASLDSLTTFQTLGYYDYELYRGN